MIKILLYFILVLALGFGFSWLADRPGELSLVFEGRLIEMSLTVAATLVLVLIALVMFVWWLVRTIWTSPHSVRRYFRARTRDRGYQALSTGLIAAGAGNAALARKMSARARGLIRADQEPLIAMLEAQTALGEGRYEEARRLFQQMADDPETRELGLRGLYVEANRVGAHEAARQYAETAAETAPYLPWAAKATLEYRCQSGRWDDAVRLLDQQRVAGVIDRKEADRLKAVLLTAKADEVLEADPATARDNALQALKLAKTLVPAAVIAAKAYIREDNLRKAASTLEKLWKLDPHPEIAAAYVRMRGGDAAVERLQRAEKLETMRPHHPEALLSVAEAALDAKDFLKARRKAEAAARKQASERAFLLLADIEEAETGDQGRVRHWMAQALKAPREPAWVADGIVSEKWMPISPVTGKLDAFEWKVPFGQLSGPVEEGSAHRADNAFDALPPLKTKVKEAPVAAAVPSPASRPAQTEQTEPEAQAPEPLLLQPSATPEEKPEPVPAPAPQPAVLEPASAALDDRQKTPEPFFGRAPDDPGVRDPSRPPDEKTRLRLF